MRHATSCAQCRTAKQKCSGINDGTSCKQCVRGGKICSFAGSDTAAQVPQNSLSEAYLPVSLSGNRVFETRIGLSTRDGYQLVADYLRYIHDRPHSLFHIATLYENIKENRVSTGLLCSICCLGASVTSSANLRPSRAQLAALAKQLVLSQLEDICLQSIQACILLANISAVELKPSAEAMYFGAHSHRALHL